MTSGKTIGFGLVAVLAIVAVAYVFSDGTFQTADFGGTTPTTQVTQITTVSGAQDYQGNLNVSTKTWDELVRSTQYGDLTEIDTICYKRIGDDVKNWIRLDQASEAETGDMNMLRTPIVIIPAKTNDKMCGRLLSFAFFALNTFALMNCPMKPNIQTRTPITSKLITANKMPTGSARLNNMLNTCVKSLPKPMLNTPASPVSIAVTAIPKTIPVRANATNSFPFPL